jgi:hypothetical protein
VDTSVWYAADASDAGNARAKSLLSSGEPLVNSDNVLVETWTLIRYRIHKAAAERFWACCGAEYRESNLWERPTWKPRGAASFDSDFAIFRFGPRRRQAFTVLR